MVTDAYKDFNNIIVTDAIYDYSYKNHLALLFSDMKQM